MSRDSEMMRVLATLSRGDVVKLERTEWVVRTKCDDLNYYVYKWPSKKQKLYTLCTRTGDAVVVFEVGGSGQRIGEDLSSGSLTEKSVRRNAVDLDTE